MHDPKDGPALWEILKRYGFYEEQFNLGHPAHRDTKQGNPD